MSKVNVTMSDIGKEMGVSTVTVSKALGDKDGVSEELRERIKIKALEMGYRYNSLAKAAKEGMTYNIGIIAPKRYFDENASFYWLMYQHIVEHLARHSYYGILDVISDEKEQANELPNVVLDNKIDGLIVLGQLSEDYVQSISKINIPMVFLDFYSSKAKVDTVLSDNFYGSYMITSYLLEKGHNSIAFVGSINATSSIQDRYLGYYKALLEYKVPIKEEFVIKDRDDGNIFTEFDLPKKMPTAFVCNCDETAYRLINQLKAMGLNVPFDASVVGYDNYIFSTLSQPEITTVDVNMRRMSAEAVNIVIRKIEDPSFSSGRTLVTGNLIKRHSVKRPRK